MKSCPMALTMAFNAHRELLGALLVAPARPDDDAYVHVDDLGLNRGKHGGD